METLYTPPEAARVEVPAQRRAPATEGHAPGLRSMSFEFIPATLTVSLPVDLNVGQSIGGTLLPEHIAQAAHALQHDRFALAVGVWQDALRSGDALPGGAHAPGQPDPAPDRLRRGRGWQYFDRDGQHHGGGEPFWGTPSAPDELAYTTHSHRVNPGHLPTEWLCWLNIRAKAVELQGRAVESAANGVRAAASRRTASDNYAVHHGTWQAHHAEWVAAALGFDPALIAEAASAGTESPALGKRGLTTAQLRQRNAAKGKR